MAVPAVALLTGLIQLAPALTRIFKGNETSVEVAEVAAAVARQVSGTSSNDAALEAFKTNPELLLAYQNALIQQEDSLEKYYVQDKESARLRDQAFLTAGTRNYRGDVLVAFSLVTVFAILAIVIIVPELNEYAKGILTTILGVFLNQLTNVFAFEFGTTRKKEDTSDQIFKDFMEEE